MLADEWLRTSVMALVVAAIAGVRAGTANPRWDVGDLLVGVYFAALSLLFWARATRANRGRAISRSATLRVISLIFGLGVGGLLVLSDIATSGTL